MQLSYLQVFSLNVSNTAQKGAEVEGAAAPAAVSSVRAGPMVEMDSLLPQSEGPIIPDPHIYIGDKYYVVRENVHRFHPLFSLSLSLSLSRSLSRSLSSLFSCFLSLLVFSPHLPPSLLDKCCRNLYRLARLSRIGATLEYTYSSGRASSRNDSKRAREAML